MNRFKGERLPAAADPADQARRDYMVAYMRARRAKLRAARGTVALNVAYAPGSPEQIAQSLAASIAATKRRARPGFCAICGHASPVVDCPVCTIEAMGRHASAEPIAWDALIGASQI